MNISPLRSAEKIFYTICLAALVVGSCADFFDIAWGTGVWLGELSPGWAVIFAAYCVFCLAFLAVIAFVTWRDKVYLAAANKVISLRNQMGALRWLSAILIFIFPIWLFQFTVWGIVFEGLFIRSLLWLIVLLLVAVLITDGAKPAAWTNFLVTLILTASAFSIAASLKFVTDYPFSLGWSEGNRLWDYSIMFGRDRYDYPADKEIFVLLEQGRQFVGGIPFLFNGISIKGARAWGSLLTVWPYLLLGLVSFRPAFREKKLWMILALWTYLFLKQGPIHPPLIFSATLTALAWGSSLWFSIPLLVLAGYFANISRYTWIFAPAIWIFLLEFSGASLDKNGKLGMNTRLRAVTLFCFGLFGSILLPILIQWFQTGQLTGNIAEGLSLSPGGVQEQVTRQALLWYRLFPNPTYGIGIIFGLLLAAGPLAYFLFYLARDKRWKMNVLQVLAILLPLLAFLGVGLVVSAKIGGGGDLHNMDMLLIGLYFSMMIAWVKGGRDWLETINSGPGWVKLLIVISLVIPALGPLQEMRSYDLGEKASWLVVLTDAPNEKSLEMYPSQDVIDNSLDSIQTEVDLARVQGEILFLDQRQLLTFGFITDVPLVPDYDKKVLIERALASERSYFDGFYKDLQEDRFSLIVTQSLSTSKKGSEYEFGEENDAWVKWISRPLLCYYEIKQTLAEVNVQLLVPRQDAVDCSKKLP